jgi:CelD/BcsL family acetyltransferase involved in cellulose biosynthesis
VPSGYDDLAQAGIYRVLGEASVDPADRGTGIEVGISRFVSIAQLEPLWSELEARAEPSFFLSWIWIRTWLEVSEANPWVVTACAGGRVVGLGLFNPTRRGRFGLAWPALALNEAGRDDFDSVMIEDNGFLAERGFEPQVTAACVSGIARMEPNWRELRLSGVPQGIAAAVTALELPVRIEAKRTSYVVDTAAVGSDGQLVSLSANTRQQINRSLRLYAERGPVVLERSPDLDSAMARFAELEALHQQRWRAKGEPGAFGEPFFGRFHRALFVHGFPAGAVDVLRVAAGAETIGLLHTFIYRGEAYAYQSGLKFEPDSRLKPGLVSHLLAIRHCRDTGLHCYRLLAGDSRYKRSLATGSYDLYWLSVRRPSTAFRLEQLARRIARREV